MRSGMMSEQESRLHSRSSAWGSITLAIYIRMPSGWANFGWQPRPAQPWFITLSFVSIESPKWQTLAFRNWSYLELTIPYHVCFGFMQIHWQSPETTTSKELEKSELITKSSKDKKVCLQVHISTSYRCAPSRGGMQLPPIDSESTYSHAFTQTNPIPQQQPNYTPVVTTLIFSFSSASVFSKCFLTQVKISFDMWGGTAFPICLRIFLPLNTCPWGNVCRLATSLQVNPLRPVGWPIPFAPAVVIQHGMMLEGSQGQ